MWTGETGRVQENIDISVAVATDNGLITPIIKNAIGLGVAEIASTIKVRGHMIFKPEHIFILYHVSN